MRHLFTPQKDKLSEQRLKGQWFSEQLEVKEEPGHPDGVQGELIVCHLEEIIWERVKVEKDFVSSRISYHKADVTFYFFLAIKVGIILI